MYNQNKINLLGEDAKLPTMSFDPATQSYNYNILKDPTGVPIKDPATGSYIPTEVAVIPKEAMSYDIHNVFAAITLTQPVFMGDRSKPSTILPDMASSLPRQCATTSRKTWCLPSTRLTGWWCR